MSQTVEHAADASENLAVDVILPRGKRLARISSLLASHAINDFYTALLPPLIGILEVRCQLIPRESAWLLGMGSLVSGLSQPCFAWLSDRFHAPWLGSLGLALTAVGLCLIGTANSFASLLVVYLVGMMGAGMYHPAAASSVGTLSGARRSEGVSAFFVAGMIGAVVGGYLAPRIAGREGGFDVLHWLILPGILVAVGMQHSMRHIPQRYDTLRGRPSTTTGGCHFGAVAVLYVASAMRFTVNMALVYLYTRWAQEYVAPSQAAASSFEISRAASDIVGNLSSLTFLGMGLGGLFAGIFVRSGRERPWLIMIPLAFSASIWVFPHVDLPLGYALAVLAGFGFASMVPVGVSLAQQLLPSRINLASGLMLGGAWAVAMVGPPLAQWGVARIGTTHTFTATAIVLACSGLICIPCRFKTDPRD